MRSRWLAVAAISVAGLLAGPQARAQQPQHPVPGQTAPVPPPAKPVKISPGQLSASGKSQQRGPVVPGVAPRQGPVAPHPLHAQPEGHDEGGHGAHDAAPKPINWWHGWIGKKDDVEPTFVNRLLWRSPEQDAPFLAALLNFAVFAWVIVRFGKKPLQESLTKRKDTILRDIETAQKMREEAEKRLQEYEDKLAHVDQEIERIRSDFREQGERDRQRIQREAEEKRDRMLRDAQFLIEQEAKEIRSTLLRETVEAAVKEAEEVLRARVTDQDQAQLAEQFLKQIALAKGATTSKGGAA